MTAAPVRASAGLDEAALWAGPWPAEDGGPRRTAIPSGLAPLDLGPANRLATTAVRDALGTTMIVLRDPGEVFVLRHTFGRRPLRDPSVAWVEQIDPETLEPIRRSPALAAGPFWPGGIAAHANGSLHVVMGNHCHRLSPDLEVLATTRLPGPRPYNSFVVLPDGALVTKDFDRDGGEPSHLVVLDPDTLDRLCEPVPIGEAAIARLSADGNDVYVIGATEAHRFHWRGGSLDRDEGWRVPYLQPGGSYGWDPVVTGGHLWFLDNGAHDFVTTMRGAGVSPGPVRLWRISLADPGDRESVEVCGLPYGAVTDPPVVDATRGIAIAYDSANGVVQAFSLERLEPLWRRELSHAAHMILFPESGELVLHDFHGPSIFRTRAARAVGRRFTAVMRHGALRRLATRGSRDEVVVVDIESGQERGRAAVPTLMQSVVFPSPGFDRDLYWCTMTAIGRIQVTR